MSEDRPGSGMPADGLSEEQVARLLRTAGPDAPTPADVVTRMDAVLADLVAERAAGNEDPERDPGSDRTAAADPARAVVSLDAERSRRRTWGVRALVAAAVLGVAGIGLSVVDDLTGGSGAESASAGDAAGAQAESDDAGALDQPDRASESTRAPKVPRLLRITDSADLRAAVRGTAAGDVAALSDLGYLAAADRAGAGRCVTPEGPGRRTLVSYRGDPATLVVRRSGDRLDGRVYGCELGRQLDGVEIGPAGE